MLNSSERAGAYLLERFSGESREVIYELCLDRKGKLLACKRLGKAACPTRIWISASWWKTHFCSVPALSSAHNHPSGVALPSPEDYATTDRAKQAHATVGVPLTDHIIVADQDFVSFAVPDTCCEKSNKCSIFKSAVLQ